MHYPRIITIGLLASLAAGMHGCSWLGNRGNWPWSRREVPVTRATWTASENWPKNPPKQPPDNARTKTPATGVTTTQPTTRAAGGGGLQATGRPQEITTSVLSIKGKFITVGDILRDADKRLSTIPRDVTEGRFRAAAMPIIAESTSHRINSELVLSEADARLSKEQKEHVDTQVTDTRRKMIAEAGGSVKKLQISLAEQGLTIQDVLDDYRRSSTVHLYLQIKFLPAILINRQMLLSYYNSHPKDFYRDKKVAMQIMAAPFAQFLPKDKDIAGTPSPQELTAAKAKAREVINKAAKRISAGEDFTKVVKDLSKGIKANTGGKWSLMVAGSFLQKEVEDAAFALKEGRVSQIVQTSGGYYIVKAYDVREGKVTSFEDAQETIDGILRARQFDKLTSGFYKRLAEEAAVQQDIDFINAALSRAVELYWKKPKANP